MVFIWILQWWWNILSLISKLVRLKRDIASLIAKRNVDVVSSSIIIVRITHIVISYPPLSVFLILYYYYPSHKLINYVSPFWSYLAKEKKNIFLAVVFLSFFFSSPNFSSLFNWIRGFNHSQKIVAWSGFYWGLISGLLCVCLLFSFDCPLFYIRHLQNTSELLKEWLYFIIFHPRTSQSYFVCRVMS